MIGVRVGLGLLAAGLGLLGAPQAASAAGSAYVTNEYNANVSQFDVVAGGALTAKTPATVATGTSSTAPVAVAVTPDGRSVYVTSTYGGVSQFDVGAGGALSAKTPAVVPAGSNPGGVAVTPDGRSVYVTNYSSNSVSQFDVGASGTLSAKTPATVGTDIHPLGVAVTPDGRSAYVTNYSSGTVSQYDVGADGALSAKTPATVAAGSNPLGVAVTPDGRSAYVTNQYSDSMSQFDVGAGGALSAKTPATVAAGGGPFAVAVQPDQGPVAAFSVAAGAAGSPTRFDGSPSSDSDGSVVRYDWDFGDGSAPNAGPMPSHTYATPGSYTATLTVTDDAGCSSAQVFTGQTVSCNGTAAARSSRTVGVSPMSSTPVDMTSTPVDMTSTPVGMTSGGFDTTAPGVSGYRLTNTRFVVGGSSTPTLGFAAKAKRYKKGTTIKYTLSEAATVRIVIAQRRAGRLKGKRCVAPSRKLRHASKCTRITTRGTLTRVSRQGANSVPFSGRIGPKALSPGSYQATLTATDAAKNTFRAKTVSFGIVKR